MRRGGIYSIPMPIVQRMFHQDSLWYKTGFNFLTRATISSSRYLLSRSSAASSAADGSSALRSADGSRTALWHWNAAAVPGRILLFFTGFDVNNKDSLQYVKEQFEKGFLGIGEYVGACYARESAAYNAGWKPEHPMDGYFPEVYELYAQYDAPILLHIDPPFPDFISIIKFEEALAKHPDTTFIYAHANAFNTPDNLERLLEKYPNLYIDFFAGFNVYNEQANLPLDAYIPLIEKYHTKFLVSTDSGYGMKYYQAYEAIYELLDKVNEQTREVIAYKNFECLMEQRKSKM
jgi:predicted TIM-barrel fold metal-dependent hydrolase